VPPPPQEKIGIVGLGYVGLPLALAFARKFDVVGFDVSRERVKELRQGNDHTGEVDPRELKNPRLAFTADAKDLGSCTFVIVAVPTPINKAKEPDLLNVIEASESVGSVLRKGMAVVYESTVYPGVTEDTCLPILERKSGLKLGDFDLGYSPERVNPGDKEHTIEKIVKVVSGHSAAALDRIAAVYGAIVTAGVHRAPNIKTAEAAKVIENVQRDLNIALMNELSMIFSRLGLHTHEVLAASATKWNFHRYTPGLVGGHCIGVDPYYLTHRALELGYHPEVILAGRRINDSMGFHVGDMVIRELVSAGTLPKGANVWVLGLTFKENVPDFRNTRAVDVISQLQKYGVDVTVWEPLVDAGEIRRRFQVETKVFADVQNLDAVVVVNGHQAFRSLKLQELRRRMRTPLLIDIKNFFPRAEAEAHGFIYFSL